MRKSTYSRSRRLWVSVALIVLAMMSLTVIIASNLSARSVDVTRIDDTINGAINATQVLALEGSSPGTRPEQYRSDDEGFVKAASDEFSNYYTGDVLARKIQEVKSAVDGKKSNTDTSDAAGVSSIKIADLDIKGDRATATAESEDWADYVQPNPDGSPFHFHPEGTTEYSFSLVREDDGTWLIDGEQWDFGPDSAP